MHWLGSLISDDETVAKNQINIAASFAGDVEAADGTASTQLEDSAKAAPLPSEAPTPCSLDSSPSSSISGAAVAIETDTDTDTSTTENVATVSFRPLRSSDRRRIQQLHEEWFPVSYSDDFYDDLVNNHRLATSGDQLFTCVATLNDDSRCKSVSEGEDDTHLYCQSVGDASLPLQQQQKGQQEEDDTIIGCAVGAFIHHTRLSPATSELLVPNSQQHPKLFYIMTLGTVKEYRNLGVATLLIQKIADVVEKELSAGTIYLHVIPYNKGAIRLYQKLGYYRVSTIPNYYQIDNKNYDCYLYAKYYHGNRGHRTLYRLVSGAISSIWHAVKTPLTLFGDGDSDAESDDENDDAARPSA